MAGVAWSNGGYGSGGICAEMYFERIAGVRGRCFGGCGKKYDICRDWEDLCRKAYRPAVVPYRYKDQWGAVGTDSRKEVGND